MKRFSLFLLSVFLISVFSGNVLQGQTFQITITDQNPTTPLQNPIPGNSQPRYVSGFGQGDSFTVFFEDRDNSGTISFVTTTTGATGFPSNPTPTNITGETHFCVKDWPITIGGITYNYRGWGAVGNNPDHKFYVSNDMVNWTLISTFQIPNDPSFTTASGNAYYGFHDVIKVNNTYYAFTESNTGQTMICKSANGDDNWVAFASVGGTSPSYGNLTTPVVNGFGWTPTGSFVDLGLDRGFGKFYVSPNNDNMYLAINTAAKSSMAPADLEAALFNPANWTWNDGSTGPASNPIFSETSEHDIRECWVVPRLNPNDKWEIIYDADFGTADGGKALGHLIANPPVPLPISNWALWVGLLLIVTFMGFKFRKKIA